jgi:hypothetical protein
LPYSPGYFFPNQLLAVRPAPRLPCLNPPGRLCGIAWPGFYGA